MTMQIDDTVNYLDNEYSLFATDNGSLFEPNDYGFCPIGLNTAFWRGHYCKYSIENDSLMLSQLSIGLETDNPPTWRGVKASGGDWKNDYWIYQGVNLLIDYSGGMIIVRNFLEEFFNSLGFFQPHCYENIIELIFEKGRIVQKVVHDKYMDKAREILRKSSQIVEKSIGYYEGSQAVTIKLPNHTDIKVFSLVVKDIASEYTNLTSVHLFNNFRSKGYVELDKKLYFGEYRKLSSCFEEKGFKNVVLTEYSTDCNSHLDLDTVIAQQPNSGQLIKFYSKYHCGKIVCL